MEIAQFENKLQFEVRDEIVNKRFKVMEVIGSGNFGVVRSGIDIISKRMVAVKMEPTTSVTTPGRPQRLEREYSIYKILKGGPGIASCYFYGQHVIDSVSYNVLVMELLGPNLEYYFDLCNHKFTLKTVLLLTDQILSLVEFLHYRNMLHRDIKPENFVMGLGSKADRLHIIDFGLSKQYSSYTTKQHLQDTKGHGGGSVVGTARYASVNALHGYEHSRRDDLEACGYMFIYFLRSGKLPWMNLPEITRALKYQKIREVKKKMTPKEICKGLPDEFEYYLSYCKGLDFDEKPNYAYLRNLFYKVFHKHGFKNDAMYDWKTIQTSEDYDGNSDSQEYAANKMSTSSSIQIISSQNNPAVVLQ